MSDTNDAPGSNAEPSQEPPSRSTGGRPEEDDRQTGEGWFDRLRAAVGLKSLSFRRELEDALEDEGADSAFSPAERAMLNNILRLRGVRVEDIMVPRADIDAVDEGTTLGDLMIAFQECGHSRMAVYRETLDDPVGMVHIKDLVAAMVRATGSAAGKDAGALDFGRLDLGQTIAEAGLIRDVLFVPPSMPVATLLSTMQNARTQMALVIDEYGGTDGLLSLEDAVETIVGEIEDEHDEDEPDIIAEGDGVFIADASASLEDVSAAVGGGLAAPDANDDVETIGGMVFGLLGRIPAAGERVTAPSGHEIVILDADPRRIRRLKIVVPGGESPASGVGVLPRTASGA